DANGIVNVSAKDLGTGKEQHITITASSNMSDGDIEKAVREAAEFEAQDKKRKEGIDARNDAEATIFSTKNALDEVGDKLDAGMKSQVQADIDALQKLVDETAGSETLTDSQISALKSGQENLLKNAQALFARVYEQAQGQSGPQGNPFGGQGPQGYGGQGPQGGGSNGPDDDVIDADFKEV
ncbi:MAG: Hsp70 family protein, partial [Lachnospiraceae bacterium]|nr:Hsp70 family protein [Lachnospiraceae bacterium]